MRISMMESPVQDEGCHPQTQNMNIQGLKKNSIEAHLENCAVSMFQLYQNPLPRFIFGIQSWTPSDSEVPNLINRQIT